ncbi:hypothetical protein CEP53_009607 [Fusarium sp. AF-6]|nr:hypothetical protein CEP53_009607 [Fusarium sp. AF-6]
MAEVEVLLSPCMNITIKLCDTKAPLIVLAETGVLFETRGPMQLVLQDNCLSVEARQRQPLSQNQFFCSLERRGRCICDSIKSHLAKGE